jgi:CBS domain containing-hemolysin-like protein
VVALIGANGFFVAAEFALVAVDRNELARLAESGDRRARRVQGLVSQLSFHLSGAQLGITVTSLVLGFLSAPLIGGLLAPLLRPVVGESAAAGVGVVVALVVATGTQMVVGEVMPKTYAIARPVATSRRLAGIITAYGVVFGPVIRFLDGAANRTVRAFGMEPAAELSQVRTLTEFEVLFRSAAEGGALQATSAELLARSLRLAGRTAADVLVPRTSVQALPTEATVADLVAASRRTGHSRLVVYGNDLDDLRGVVHVKAAYAVDRADRSATTVADVMGELLAVPESRDLDDLLGDMRSTRHHLVAVVDEHGGTAGIVTLEDVLEQVVGDITDEHDVRAPALTPSVRPGEWVLDGGTRLDQLAQQTGLVLPDGGYETVAGFVLDRLGHLPVDGEGIEHDGWTLTVTAMDRRRVATVRVVRPTRGAPVEAP